MIKIKIRIKVPGIISKIFVVNNGAVEMSIVGYNVKKGSIVDNFKYVPKVTFIPETEFKNPKHYHMKKVFDIERLSNYDKQFSKFLEITLTNCVHETYPTTMGLESLIIMNRYFLKPKLQDIVSKTFNFKLKKKNDSGFKI